MQYLVIFHRQCSKSCFAKIVIKCHQITVHNHLPAGCVSEELQRLFKLFRMLHLLRSTDLYIIFPWHYSPLWALACQTMSFHFFPSATNSPSSHSQHLKICFYFLFPSFPGSSPSSRPFQLLSEDLFGHSTLLPGFSMISMFHAARFISVYLIFFRPSRFNPSSFFLCSTLVTISFLTGWGC